LIIRILENSHLIINQVINAFVACACMKLKFKFQAAQCPKRYRHPHLIGYEEIKCSVVALGLCRRDEHI